MRLKSCTMIVTEPNAKPRPDARVLDRAAIWSV
jgi:hypothetical protein